MKKTNKELERIIKGFANFRAFKQRTRIISTRDF